MKILVTGGAGFIGSNFIRHIKNKYPDYMIVNLDKLTYAGNLDNLKDIEGKGNYEFVKGDICDEKLVDSVVNGCDFVVNFAAESHVDRSIKGVDIFLQTNIMGTHTLLEAALRNNVKKFLQISTDEVYGSIEKGSFNEKSPLSPSSPYSASKAAADHLANSYFVTYGLPVLVTRSSNNFGPYQFPEKIIPLFITNLLQGNKVPLYGDGLNVRDWLFVEDNCKAIDMVLHEGTPGEIYNIGGGFEISNKRLTELLLEIFNLSNDHIEYVVDRPGHDRRYSLSSDKVIKLGWEAEFMFDDALRATVDWYKDNEEWWKKVKERSKAA